MFHALLLTNSWNLKIVLKHYREWLQWYFQNLSNPILVRVIFLRVVNYTDFTVSLQKVKIILAKFNGELVTSLMWLNYACNLRIFFHGIKVIPKILLSVTPYHAHASMDMYSYPCLYQNYQTMFIIKYPCTSKVAMAIGIHP